jgi:phospholipid/cholesterol/gamma-HCH transport system substrate-binding protein
LREAKRDPGVVRRIVAIALVLAAVAAVVATGTAADGDGGAYEVRAIFDNGAFLVEGEEVRVAGARVGTVSEIDISGPDEPVREDGSPDPGKAVVVLEIDDAAFQDFRADASCLIRPQSLLGEKFVECEPTQPRAAASELPPPLEEIPEGERGEGQLLLPLEQNGKAVDLDLINNIMREPYPDRFRLILNDLGAGLAARGDELAQIINRSNPALRETNQVLAILARQNQALARLARDGEAVLEPLARERDRVSGFINSSAATAEATAERGEELEDGLELLPQTLREVEETMVELERFSDAGTPLFTDLAAAAEPTTRLEEALPPFADAATGALVSLGDAAEETQEPLVDSDPVIRDLRKLANSAAPAATNLSRFLRSMRKKDGFRNLLRFVYRATGSFNVFDNLGHFARAFLLITNCNDYVTAPQTGCIANFIQAAESSAASAGKDDGKRKRRERDPARDRDRDRGEDSKPGRDPGQQPGGEAVPEAEGGESEPADPDGQAPEIPETPEIPAEPGPGNELPTEPGTEGAPGAPASALRMRDARLLLDLLIGDGGDRKRGRRGGR